jgi:hypothetical protein
MAYSYKYPKSAVTADNFVINAQWFYIDALTLQSFVCHDIIIEEKCIFHKPCEQIVVL